MSSKPRIMVRAGKMKVGDIFKGWSGETYKCIGLGKEFTKFIKDEDACCYGLMPGNDYHIEMQYAYTEEIK